MKQQPDTTSKPPEQPQRQLWPGRDRGERVALFVLAFVSALAAYVAVRWTLTAGWPIWLTVLVLTGTALALYYLWYRRRRPVTAAA